MRKLTILGALAANLVMSPVIAGPLTVCPAPQPPQTGMLSKPIRPYCLRSRSCNEYEVFRYNRKLAEHFLNLQRYTAEVDRYFRASNEYLRCMREVD